MQSFGLRQRSRFTVQNVKVGNLGSFTVQQPETRSWVIGHFMPEETGWQCDDFEMKWVTREKDELKPGHKAKQTTPTLGVCIFGKIAAEFPETGEVIMLEKPGDYVFYGAGQVAHQTRYHEDSVMMTIRWPSKRAE